MSLNYGGGPGDIANTQVGQDLLTGGFNAYEMQYLDPQMGFGAGAGGMPMGAALAGLARGMAPQVRQGFSPDDPAASQIASRSQNQLPGPFQKSVPNTPVGLSVADIGGMPTPANQSAIMGVRTTPTGHEWPAGSPVKSNYSNLNGLRNRAYGVNYG